MSEESIMSEVSIDPALTDAPTTGAGRYGRADPAPVGDSGEDEDEDRDGDEDEDGDGDGETAGRAAASRVAATTTPPADDRSGARHAQHAAAATEVIASSSPVSVANQPDPDRSTVAGSTTR